MAVTLYTLQYTGSWYTVINHTQVYEGYNKCSKYETRIQRCRSLEEQEIPRSQH